MPINKKSTINNIITWLHLWLGLISGIIVVIVSITGCIFTFQKEISGLIYKEELFVTPPSSNAKPLPISELKESAQEALGADQPINYITTYTDRSKSWEFLAYKAGDPNAITFPESIDYYESAFVNPYTGKVTGKINYMNDFFVIVKYIHWSLYLSTKYGQPIVGWGTLIFIISLITGLIMWIPKRWSKFEKNKAFKVKWRARWKRLNYDLHNVLGFYTILIALILGLSGMLYSFQWFSKAAYATATLSTEAPPFPSYTSKEQAAKQASPEALPIDKALARSKQKFQGVTRYGISIPQTSKAPITVSAYNRHEVYYDYDAAYFDQYSGKELGLSLYKDKNAGQKLLAMKYDIHVGAIGGIWGKIIAFLVSLVCASLPITGFIIWWGKKTKKKPKRKPLRQKRKKEKEVAYPV